jgi:hypothetical protein
MQTMHFFLYRQGAFGRDGCYQLVELYNTSVKSHRVSRASPTVYSDFQGGWRAETMEELEDRELHTRERLNLPELTFLQNFKINNNNVSTSWTMVLDANPAVRYRAISLEGETLPARGGYEVNSKTVPTGFCVMLRPLYIHACSSDCTLESNVKLIEKWVLDSLTDKQYHNAQLLSETLKRYYRARLAVQPVKRIVRHITKPLSAFVAKQLADHQIQQNAECPIEMEPLASYKSLLVPTCGHICGPSAKGQIKCPVCREETQWTEVVL